MTSIDDMTEEIVKGLTEYSELADTAMKKAVRKTATSVKNEISANAPVKSGRYKKAGRLRKSRKTAILLKLLCIPKTVIKLPTCLKKVTLSVAADV